MILSLKPSEKSLETASYLMDSFINAADGNTERAGELAQIYIRGMQRSNNLAIRETAQCLSLLATTLNQTRRLS